jgi:hypothetical protein
MAELKTKKTDANVDAFLESVEDEQQRADARVIAKMMQHATGAKPKMWGPSIVGFGDCVCTYPSGRVLDWFPLGFSPRKGSLSLYLQGGLEKLAPHLKKLGKYKTGKGCLYIKRLPDVDPDVLREMIQASAADSEPRIPMPKKKDKK